MTAVIFVLLPTAFATDGHHLRAADATASSFLYGGYNRHLENYHPNYVLDDDPETAWLEGVDGLGEGEELVIAVTAPAPVGALTLRIRNGYQKSDKLLRANSAPQQVELVLTDSLGARVSTTEHSLDKKMGWQELVVEVPDRKDVASVALKVLTAHAGTVYKDTCISDIQLFTGPSAPVNAEVQAAAHSQLMAWVSERAAEAGAASGGKEVFASGMYQVADRRKQAASAVAPLMHPHSEQALSLSKSRQWFKVETVARLALPPEGLPELKEVLELAHTDLISIAEAQGQFVHFNHTEHTENGWGLDRAHRTNVAIDWHPGQPRRPHAVFYTDLAERQYMVGMKTHRDLRKVEVLARYNTQGGLQSVWTRQTNDNVVTEVLAVNHFDARGLILESQVAVLKKVYHYLEDDEVGVREQSGLTYLRVAQ